MKKSSGIPIIVGLLIFSFVFASVASAQLTVPIVQQAQQASAPTGQGLQDIVQGFGQQLQGALAQQQYFAEAEAQGAIDQLDFYLKQATDKQLSAALSKAIGKNCEVHNLLDNIFSNWDQKLNGILQQSFNAALTTLIGYGQCYIDNTIQTLICKAANITVLGSGSPSGCIKPVQCTKDLPGAITATMQQQAKLALATSLGIACFNKATTQVLASDLRQIVLQSGRDGGPAWEQNFSDLEPSATARGHAIFCTELVSADICPYLQTPIYAAMNCDPNWDVPVSGTAGSLEPQESQTSFASRVACSMSDDFDPDAYTRDFGANGGWDTYAQLMLSPENNFQQLLAIAQSEESAVVNREIEADKTEVIANGGVFGISNCAVRNRRGMCLRRGPILVPGAVQLSAINKSLDIEIQNFFSQDIAVQKESAKQFIEHMLGLVTNMTAPEIPYEFRIDTGVMEGKAPDNSASPDIH